MTKPPEPQFVLRGHNGTINSVHFHPNQQDRLASGDSCGEIKIWNLSRRRYEFAEILHDGTSGIQEISYCNNGKSLITQGRDCIRVLDANTMKTIRNISRVSPYFCKHSMFQGTMMVLCSEVSQQTRIEVIQVDSEELIYSVDPNTFSEKKLGMCMCTKAYSVSNSCVVISSFEDGGVYVFDCTANKMIASKILHTEPAMYFDVDISLSKGVSVSAGNNIVIFEIDFSKGQLNVLKEFNVSHGGFSDVKIRPDNKIFATAGWDHRVRIFDWKKQVPLAILKFHTEGVYSVDFAPIANLLASGSKDKRIAIWVNYYDKPTRDFTSLAFSPQEVDEA